MFKQRPLTKALTPAARLTTAPALLCAVLGLAACGGTSSNTTHATDAATDSTPTQPTRPTTTEAPLSTSSIPPGTVVAHVGSTPITFATVRHQMALKNHATPLPDPPSYPRCIKGLEALALKAGAPAAQRTEAKLKANCAQHYRALLEEGLSTAIHDQWLIGEAGEEGIKVSPKEIREEFDSSKNSAFKTEAEFARYRKSVGEGIPDMLFELKIGKLTEKIFKRIAAKEHPPTEAEVAAYYSSHRKQFSTPPGRAVRIVRTATAGPASKIKQELQSGKSFASVAKELSAVGQPIGAKDGEVADLKPGVFEEKSLNDAIFNAKLHRLYGPLQLTAIHKTIAPETNTGFFIFEVTAITPGSQAPLSKVKATLTEELTKAQREHTVPPFILAYRARWTGRTDCRPGYVVKYCKQFKSSKAQEAVDPYTL